MIAELYNLFLMDTSYPMFPKRRDSKPVPRSPRDRGPAHFFHGRKEIIDDFSIILDDAKVLKDGTTFLIQGAPGVGKTALIDVLAKQARENGWKAVDIFPNALWNPVELIGRLNLKKILPKISGASAEVSVGDAASATISIDFDHPAETILKILSAQKKPLLLILDEAQSLGKPKIVPDEMKGITASVLKQIHNGDLGKSVMFIAGGLGTTEHTLNTFSVSLFEGDCRVYLGRLSPASERAVIKDWLTHVTGGNPATPTWIDAIAERTHGWPQHIMSYVKPAVKYLRANNRDMTDASLETVLARGDQLRLKYYDGRAHDIDERGRIALAQSVLDVSIDSTTTQEAVIASLQKSGFSKKESKDLFECALDQGILDKCGHGRYGIPIPSMHKWLKDNYGNDRGKADCRFSMER